MNKLDISKMNIPQLLAVEIYTRNQRIMITDLFETVLFIDRVNERVGTGKLFIRRSALHKIKFDEAKTGLSQILRNTIIDHENQEEPICTILHIPINQGLAYVTRKNHKLNLILNE